ncbi:MAG: hypothetical protein NT139_02935 [Candidatus Woesearchaeota archaeon]|nr:hypothetical protein [Candidatus Woesearchaeota archaeon]
MKRGAVTLFIIIGLLIVASIITIVYFRDDIANLFRKEQTITTVTVPKQIEPIKNYIDSCIDEVSQDAIDRVSSQGGYINLPTDEIPISLANIFSSELQIFPRGTSKTIYWYYESANGIQKNQIPNLNDIEKQINDYVNNNLESCLNHFYLFPEFNIDYNKINTQTEIGDNQILINVNMPMTISREDFTFNLDDFYVSKDSSLGKLYNIAKKIQDKENSEYFLEQKTLDFMVTYKEIPYNGIDFNCAPKVWTKTKVIEDFKSILEANIPYYKIEGTNYAVNANHEYYIIKNSGISDNSVNVNFAYNKDWPFAVDIEPGDEILKGEPYTSGSGVTGFLMSLFCLNNYHFIYDIKYPVLITVSDDKGSFQFATQVIINHNQPRENRFIVDQDYSSDSIICKNKLTDMTVYVLTYDNIGNTIPLKNASISFNCFTSTCDIGKTEVQNNGDVALKAKFPQCMNGFVIASKEGYSTEKTMISSNQEAVLTMILEPIYEKNLDVKLVRDSGLLALGDKEKVMITFESKDRDYSTSIIYPDMNKIKLSAVDYYVKAYTMYENTNGIKIGDQVIPYCFDKPKDGVLGLVGMTDKECTETTIPGITLDQIIAGGVEFDFNINRQDLVNSNTLVVYSPFEKIPSTFTELNLVYKNILDNSKNKKVKLPEFRNV